MRGGREVIGYAVLVEKVGEKVGNFWIKPYFFCCGQVWSFEEKFGHFPRKLPTFFPKLPSFINIRWGIPSIIYKARHASLQSLRENRNIRTLAHGIQPLFQTLRKSKDYILFAKNMGFRFPNFCVSWKPVIEISTNFNPSEVSKN